MKAIITIGLFWGDEGKGATVDALCNALNVSCVVRYSGGYQCGHNVQVGEDKHMFSQFCAGALANVPSILHDDVIINPEYMVNERNHLLSLGLDPKIYISARCPIATEFHKHANRQYCRAGADYGSTGLGIGMTRLTKLKGCAIHLTDSPADIMYKLKWTREILEDYLHTQFGIAGNFPSLYKTYSELCKNIENVDSFANITEENMIISGEYVVFEGSQGLALNEYNGWNDKESTWGNITSRNAVEFLEATNTPYITMAVMRSYITRHGGVLPYPNIDVKSDENNPYNPYQKKMTYYLCRNDLISRFSQMDNIDCYAVNHLDQHGNNIVSPIVVKGYGPRRADKRVDVEAINKIFEDKK